MSKGSQERKRLAHFISRVNAEEGIVFPVYHRLGKGFTDMSSNLGPFSKDVQYIDGSNETITTGYHPSITVSGNVYDKDPANQLLVEMARQMVTGPSALVDYITAYMWMPSEKRTDAYHGFYMKYTWIPEVDGGGAGDDVVTFTGNLKSVDDRKQGWVIIDKEAQPAWTATFSETEPTALPQDNLNLDALTSLGLWEYVTAKLEGTDLDKLHTVMTALGVAVPSDHTEELRWLAKTLQNDGDIPNMDEAALWAYVQGRLKSTSLKTFDDAMESLGVLPGDPTGREAGLRALAGKLQEA